MTTWRCAILLIAVSGLTLSCRAQARSPEPVPVDHVECARCRMLISNAAGAAELLAAGEDTRFYDDIGCLAQDWGAHHRSAAAFVQLPGGGWGEARHAFYGRPLAARTAMGSGLAAFATVEQARGADHSGRSFTWDEVIALTGGPR
jgi:copper chaperone NosL